MITVSQSYRDSLAQNRRFDAVVNIVLNDDTVLRTLHNSDLRAFSIDNAVSEDNKFTMLGSVIINQLSLTIDNRSGEFSHRDFNAAEITCSLNYTLPNNTTETISKGIFYVNEDTYQDGIIKLKCLDNMVRFEKDYADSELTYPASLYDIVDDACTVCGVTLATTTFPHSSFVINNKPTKETSFREVLSWVAQIAGCYATCNQDGELEIKWCDQTLLANLVTAIRLNTDIPSGVYTLPSPYSVSAATDDTVLTGVSIEYEYDSVDQEGAETHEIETVMAGNVGFVVALSNNQFITDENADDIVEWLGQQLIGLRFRKVNATHLGDPTLETGDIAVAIDRKGNKYPMIVTRTTFGINARQKTVCGSETPSKNSAVRYSEIARIYTQLQQRIDKLPTNYSVANAIEHATELITGALGGYLTFSYDANGYPYEMLILDHNNVEDASNVLRLNLNGIGFSSSGVDGPYRSAWTLDGRFVADFIVAGTLSSILIKSTTTDYWNLSNSDIIDGNNTYYANTLSTQHLRAENDIRVIGGSGSRIYIPVGNGTITEEDPTDPSYINIMNRGMEIKTTTEIDDVAYVSKTVYPSDGTATIPVLSSGVWSEETINNVIHSSTTEHEDSASIPETILCNIYDDGGTYMGQGEITYNFPTDYKDVGSSVFQMNKITLDGNYRAELSEVIVDAPGTYHGWKYVPVNPVVWDKNRLTLSSYALGLLYADRDIVRNAEISAETGTVSFGGTSATWSLSLNGNDITPIAEAYPNATGHHGVPAVRVESGMATYISLGVNASSKILYVYASDNKNSLNYVGRVQLV